MSSFGNMEHLHVIEMVRRAMAKARELREKFFTSSRGTWQEAQQVAREVEAVCTGSITKHFPGWGVVSKGSTLVGRVFPQTAEFNLEPLDGGVWFTRGFSHGVALVLQVTVDGKPQMALVGDIFADSLYWWQGGDPVWLERQGSKTSLNTHRYSAYPLANELALATGLLDRYDEPTKRFLSVFGGIRPLLGMGSGVAATELWGGQCAALVAAPGEQPQHPALLTIGQRLGFRWFAHDPSDDVFVEYDPRTVRPSYGWVQFHQSLLPKLQGAATFQLME